MALSYLHDRHKLEFAKAFFEAEAEAIKDMCNLLQGSPFPLRDGELPPASSAFPIACLLPGTPTFEKSGVMTERMGHADLLPDMNQDIFESIVFQILQIRMRDLNEHNRRAGEVIADRLRNVRRRRASVVTPDFDLYMQKLEEAGNRYERYLRSQSSRGSRVPSLDEIYKTLPDPELVRSGSLSDFSKAVEEDFAKGPLGRGGRNVNWRAIVNTAASKRGVVVMPTIAIQIYVITFLKYMIQDAIDTIDSIGIWGSATRAASQRRSWIQLVNNGTRNDLFDNRINYFEILARSRAQPLRSGRHLSLVKREDPKPEPK